MHTPVTGTSVSQQAKSQTARHEQISHHSFIPAHPWFSVKVHPQRQLSPSLLLRPSFLCSSSMGHMLEGSTSKNRKAFPDLAHGCRTFLMQGKNADCGRYEGRKSHTLPWESKGEVLLECSVSLTDCFHFPPTPTPPGGLKNEHSGLALAG